MADIREFPELNELENRLARLFKESVSELIESVPQLDDEFRSIKLNEIIVFASWANDNAIIGETQLSLGFILEVPDEILPNQDPIDLENFIQARDILSGYINDEKEIEWDLFNEYFDDFDIDASFIENRKDFIIFKLNITDSVSAYSLTKDLNITVIEGEPEVPGGPPETLLDEEEAGARIPSEEEIEETIEVPPEVDEEVEEEIEERIEEEVEEVEGEEVIEEEEGVPPNDIIEFPQLDEFRLQLENIFNDAIVASEDYEQEDVEIDRIIIGSSWGDGTADYGQDPLVVNYLVTIPISQLRFRVFINTISDYIEENFEPTDLTLEWFNGIEFDILKSDQIDLVAIIRNTTGNKLYDILNNETLRVEDDEIITDVIEGAEELPEVEEVPPPEEEEEIVPEFPEVPDPLRPFAVSADRLEVPVGKETKSVEPRAIYEWETELASPQGELDGGIGEAKRAGGEEGENTFGVGIPPGTFPRTGTYIKYHLLNEGPSYVLEIYNDLIIYSAYISTIFAGNFKAGKYDSFRAYLNRVRLIPERGGPELIRELSPQQVSAMGFESIADHPSIPGEKAPWLERRTYYEVIEDNIEHPAWDNIIEFVAQLTE